MALLTTTEIRSLVETDLSDAALTLLLDDADAEIVKGYGAHEGVRTERFYPNGGDASVFLSADVNTALAVTVRRVGGFGVGAETYLASAYEFGGPRELNLASSWSGGWITVAYTPVTELPRRKRVLADLVRLAISYDASTSSRLGDVSVSHVDYESERARILGRLGRASGSFV